MMQAKKGVTLALAASVLGVAVGMAAVSAWGRGTDLVDRVLLVAMACAVVAGVHLLPALVKSLAIWPLWVALFAVAVHGHAGFLMHAGQSVSEAVTHARQAPQLQALIEQQAALQAALNGITARPVAVVAAALARDQTPERRAALQVELIESQRAVTLRDSLVNLSKERVTLASHAPASDPVTQGLALVTGLSLQSVTLLVSMVTAALLELLGVALWRAALLPEPVATALPVVTPDPARDAHLSPAPVALEPREVVSAPEPLAVSVTAPPEPLQVPEPVKTPEPVASVQTPEPVAMTAPALVPPDPLQVLREAVAHGKVKPTVTGIRRHLACSQARASELRRHLVSVA